MLFLNLAKAHCMEQSKIERLLQLIMLLASKTDHTIEDIAGRLGTTSRSIYRYIDTLRKCRFAIDKRKSNVYKLIRLPNSSVNLNNLVYFSQEEAHLVNSLIHSLEGSNTLKAVLQKKLAAIYNIANLTEVIADKEIARKIETLGEAIRNKRQVILKDYESAHSHSITDRVIEPFAFTTNYIDIWGFDIEKQENRVFKIARIGSVENIDSDWLHEENHKQSMTDCFRMNGTKVYPVKLILSLRAKNLLLEEYPLSSKDLKEEKGNWLLETEVYDLAGVGRFVMGLAGEITIVDSLELEEYISSYASKHILPYIKESETKAPL